MKRIFEVYGVDCSRTRIEGRYLTNEEGSIVIYGEDCDILAIFNLDAVVSVIKEYEMENKLT